MLEINKLTGGYVNIPVLKEVSFSVPDGQLIGLIGLNGAGKSTTINEIIGLLHIWIQCEIGLNFSIHD
jgi:ABC-2 type transport system ATP-binding protein